MRNSIGFVIDNTSVFDNDAIINLHVGAMFKLKALTDDERNFDDFKDENEYYKYLIQNQQFGKTSTASLGDIEDAIKLGLEKYEKVIVVTTAGHISSTYNNAVIASKNFDEDKVQVVDSTSVVGASRFIVEKGNELVNEGVDFKNIADQLREFAKKCRTFIIISNFDALVANGRIGKAAKNVASLLNIKAIVSVNFDGVKIVSKFRSYNKAIKNITETLKENFDEKYGVYSGHIFNEEVFLKVKATLEDLNVKVNDINIPPIIGIHGGDGLFGITYCEK